MYISFSDVFDLSPIFTLTIVPTIPPSLDFSLASNSMYKGAGVV